jgi:Flp pilus assembly protein TadG
MKRDLVRSESGQALVELAFIATTLIVFILGIVDYGRAIYDVEVMKNLAGEGSSMASRMDQSLIANAVQTVVNDAGSDLKMSSYGCVIITIVTNESGTPTITAQSQTCAITASSKIGCLQGVNGCNSSTPTLPSYASTALTTEPNQSVLAVTEIYYNFSPITPITSLLGTNAIPSQFYAVAYY